MDADEDITTVRFVDFGNTDVIDNKTTQVKTLPPNLLTLAVYATRCSLKLKSLEEEWNPQALALFERLSLQSNLQAEYLTQDEKTTILELYSNGVNVKDELLAHNYAVCTLLFSFHAHHPYIRQLYTIYVLFLMWLFAPAI